MTIINTLLAPSRHGRFVAIVNGRSLSDMALSPEGELVSLMSVIRGQLLMEGYVTVEFSRSSGLSVDVRSIDQSSRGDVENLVRSLRSEGAQNVQGLENWLHLLHGLIELSRSTDKKPSIDGKPIKLAVFAHFGEHLVPDAQPGHRSDQLVRAFESVLDLAKRPSFRKSGHLLFLVERRAGTIDPTLQSELPIVSLPMPNGDDKRSFLEGLVRRYPEARLEDGLTYDEVARSTASTPHSHTEGFLFHSHGRNEPITAKALWKGKQDSVSVMSEGTLLALDQDSNARIQLCGRMIERPMAVLLRMAEGLRKGETSTLRNILLVGPPSSGKTQLAMMVAARAKVPAFELITGKSQWVGESERRTMLQLRLLREQEPCIGIIDEVEHRMQLDRSKESHDSGTSEAIMGMYQTFLADSSLSGKVGLVATSNRVYAISEAMRQRWVVVPVFSSLVEDLPLVLGALLNSLGIEGLPESALGRSSSIFIQRQASPREMRESLIAARCVSAMPTDATTVLELAANSTIGSVDQGATQLGDLSALLYCTSSLMLPWHDASTGAFDRSFPIPNHMKPFIDAESGKIDADGLKKRVDQLRTSVNI